MNQRRPLKVFIYTLLFESFLFGRDEVWIKLRKRAHIQQVEEIL